ncbi:MAG: hypothetical protein ACQETX_04105 [Pseudomonadota bacterium]
MKLSPEAPPSLLDLPFAGQFLIWLLRGWVEECRNSGPGHPKLEDGAQAAGLSDAISDLERFMRTIAVSAPGIVVIERPNCRDLSVDERTLLSALANLQAGRLQYFEALLSNIVPPAAVRIARMPAAQLVGRFRREGLVLPFCPTETRERVSRLAICPDPGAMRLQ